MGAQIFGKDRSGGRVDDDEALPPENQAESLFPAENGHDHDHGEVAGAPAGYDPSESFEKAPGLELGGDGSYTVGEVFPGGFGNGDLKGPQWHDLALVRM